jgi:hypothetical protein
MQCTPLVKLLTGSRAVRGTSLNSPNITADLRNRSDEELLCLPKNVIAVE